MAIPVITLLVTSVLIGIQLVLTAIVIKARRGSQITVGSEGAPGLERAIRTHGNFTEATPIFLISLLLLELVDSYLWWVAILGVIFISGRVLHARSLLVTELRSGSYRQRVLGMMLTMISLGASAISGVIWIVWNLL
jgi:uncharacterized membrane protein YecN with MAPEG domain